MGPPASVEIAPYDPGWPARFETEKVALLAIFETADVFVEHVGSTAVPGLGAKPIVDLMLGVDRLETVETHIPALADAGWQYISEHETQLPERRFFAKPPERPRAFHLHAVERGAHFWARHLLFRDHLRAHPEDAQAYEQLKRRLAARYGRDREGYTDAKTDFIDDTITRARQGRS